MTGGRGSPAIEARRLYKTFGALSVADGIDFTLRYGARHAVIGPNGAGKTTFINLLTGVLSPNSGSITLDEMDITHLGQAGRVKRGLTRTFQINTLFRRLSVLDNVRLAVSEAQGVTWNMLRPAASRSDVADRAYQLLQNLDLASDAHCPVETLAYGRQRMVEIAIALALEPKVLLLDEPAAGIPSDETHRISDMIESLSPHIAVLIVEHDMSLVFRLAKRITVLVQGKVFLEGSPEEIGENPAVRKIYLGERFAH